MVWLEIKEVSCGHIGIRVTDTYTYVSSSLMCHVPNLVKFYVCLAKDVKACCMCLDFWFKQWLRVDMRNGFSLFCHLV